MRFPALFRITVGASMDLKNALAALASRKPGGHSEGRTRLVAEGAASGGSRTSYKRGYRKFNGGAFSG